MLLNSVAYKNKVTSLILSFFENPRKIKALVHWIKKKSVAGNRLGKFIANIFLFLSHSVADGVKPFPHVGVYVSGGNR